MKWKTLIPSYIKLKSIQCIWIQFDKIQIQFQFNNWIKIQLNWFQMQLKTIDIANWWKMYSLSFCEYVVGKKLIHKFEKTSFHPSSLRNELTNSNLELSNVWRLEEPKVVIPKSIPMNHCHWNWKYPFILSAS